MIAAHNGNNPNSVDFNNLGTIDHPIALAFSQQMKD
jgi:hypothetical protein